MEDLDENEVAWLGKLAVLPEDENIPLGIIEALWGEAGGGGEDEADELIRWFHGLSLIQRMDLGARTLRLHDNMIWYLRDRIGPGGLREAHAAMVRPIQAACDGEWATLPASHAYGWRFLIRHLRGAGQNGDADRLLTDYAWIKTSFSHAAPRIFLRATSRRARTKARS